MQLLSQRIPDLETVLPVVPHVADKIREQTEDWPCTLHLVGQNEKFAAFDAANVALAASGTVSTELALAGLPMVIGYKVGWLTGKIFEKMVISPFASLINIIEKKGIIPEYLQDAAQPEVLADELEVLFQDPAERKAQTDAQRAALEKMGMGQESPSLRAARVVLEMLDRPPSDTKLARGAGFRIQPRIGSESLPGTTGTVG